jgi:hypothetical protein
MPKKKVQRIEVRADAAWVRAVSVEADRWGLSVAAYIRLAVSEKMERDRKRKRPAADDDR